MDTEPRLQGQRGTGAKRTAQGRLAISNVSCKLTPPSALTMTNSPHRKKVFKYLVMLVTDVYCISALTFHPASLGLAVPTA